MMKILFVVTSMQVGGVQSVVKGLADECVRRGHDCGIVSLTGSDEVHCDPRVRRFAFEFSDLRRGRAIVAALRLNSVVRQFRPDVVHAHAFHANLVATLRSLLCRSSPLILTHHSVQEGGRFHKLLATVLFRKASARVGVSEAVRAAHPLPDRTVVIPNGVDWRPFLFDASARNSMRMELGLDGMSVCFVNVGRLTEAKDHSTLIRAFAAHSRLRKQDRLLIVGEGHLRNSLERLVEAEGVSHAVMLLGQRKDVGSVLSAGDVYVQSSAWEGMPVALLEAMGSGLPIVATSVGGTAALIPPPDRLIPPKMVQELTHALLSSLSLVKSCHDRGALDPATLTTYAIGTSSEKWLLLYGRVADCESPKCAGGATQILRRS